MERGIDVVVIARPGAGEGPPSKYASRAAAMLRSDSGSTTMCGATAITPASASGNVAAWMSAIDAPSLWPNSHGRLPSVPMSSRAKR